jgi:hypothetical protein
MRRARYHARFVASTDRPRARAFVVLLAIGIVSLAGAMAAAWARSFTITELLLLPALPSLVIAAIVRPPGRGRDA